MTSSGVIGPEEYCATAHREISRRGMYPFSCGLISIDLAKLLLETGNDPQIMGLKGQPIDTMGSTSPIVVASFEGKIRWGAHLVCISDGLAFDPIVPEPIDFTTYLDEAFIARPEIGRRFHGKELKQLVSQRATVLRNVREIAPHIVLTDIGQLSDGDWPPLG